MALVMSARQLHCERDDRLLFQQLDFDLSVGDILQVRGPNGCGKTTLLRAMVGLSDAVEGEFTWHQGYGEGDWLDPASLMFLGHKPGITGVASAIENLSFHAELKGWHQPTQDELYQALEMVGLRGFEQVSANQLSAGQQRRVALARLYLSKHQVPLWILDEPFTALDKKGVAQLEQHIQAHAKQGGSVILTTHHELNISSARMLDLEDAK